jgi:hypothetical protein
MFSTCRSLQTSLILLAFGACSKAPQPAAQPTPATPLVAAPPQAQPAPADANMITGQIDAAGIAAKYQATFGPNEQMHISEQRADSRSGEYELRGARLLHYAGNGLSSADPIELSFDLRGAMTLSKAGAGPVPATEVSAIRERAQLLRSHALAQKTSRDHH